MSIPYARPTARKPFFPLVNRTRTLDSQSVRSSNSLKSSNRSSLPNHQLSQFVPWSEVHDCSLKRFICLLGASIALFVIVGDMF